MLFCYNENIITVWEKYLFNNQDTQGYNRHDVVWGGIDMKVKMFEKFRKIKKYVLLFSFLFFADFLLKPLSYIVL